MSNAKLDMTVRSLYSHIQFRVAHIHNFVIESIIMSHLNKSHGQHISTNLAEALIHQNNNGKVKKGKIKKIKNKRPTEKTLVTGINKCGAATKDDIKIDAWAKSKRVIGATMTDTVRKYAFFTKESTRIKISCPVDSEKHKIPLVAFEKMRMKGIKEVCPECKAPLTAEITMKCRYLDANIYIETVPYLSRKDVCSQYTILWGSDPTPELQLNAYKYGLLK